MLWERYFSICLQYYYLIILARIMLGSYEKRLRYYISILCVYVKI
jgi:hypothetical protein